MFVKLVFKKCLLTACGVISNEVMFGSIIDTKAGEVYAEEKPTTKDPIDTLIAAKI